MTNYRVLLFLVLMISNFYLISAQMPKWFERNMENSIGHWIADNAAYQSEQEPFDQYGMEFRWGIGKHSIVGTLFGLIDGEKQGVFWEFRQYWDYGKQQGIIAQFGRDGSMGLGPIKELNEQTYEVIQEFINPEGQRTVHAHRNEIKDGKLITTSFDVQENGEWRERRSYTWKLIEN